MTALLADFQSPDRPTEILTAQPLWGIPLKDQSDFVHRVKSTKARKDLTHLCCLKQTLTIITMY